MEFLLSRVQDCREITKGALHGCDRIAGRLLVNEVLLVFTPWFVPTLLFNRRVQASAEGITSATVVVAELIYSI